MVQIGPSGGAILRLLILLNFDFKDIFILKDEDSGDTTGNCAIRTQKLLFKNKTCRPLRWEKQTLSVPSK
jgi:hypothetical protein